MVFDNGCHRKRGPSFSRIVEIDKETRNFVWTYANPTILAFYSFMISGCQRLPNGNTLITEGASGRLFEVTNKHKVVWEYVSPHRAGPNDELIAALLHMTRLDPDFPTDWLPPRP